jgi:hypothetical protein
MQISTYTGRTHYEASDVVDAEFGVIDKLREEANRKVKSVNVLENRILKMY